MVAPSPTSHSGRPLRFRIAVRRLGCDTTACRRTIFAEPLGPLTTPRTSKTAEFTDIRNFKTEGQSAPHPVEGFLPPLRAGTPASESDGTMVTNPELGQPELGK